MTLALAMLLEDLIQDQIVTDLSDSLAKKHPKICHSIILDTWFSRV